MTCRRSRSRIGQKRRETGGGSKDQGVTRQVRDPALSLRGPGVTAVAQVRSLAAELPDVSGVAKKKKKRPRNKTNIRTGKGERKRYMC